MSDAPEVEALRAEVADLRSLVDRISAVIVAVYGPACIAPPVARAPPAPKPEPKPRVIGTFGGGASGFFSG
jgi:hypothetical protein